MLWGQMLIWGHLGSLGSKSHFHHKCYNLSMLHIMTIYSYKVLISICFRSSVTFVGSVTDNLGSVRGQCLKSPAGYAVCDGNVSSSSFFFLLLLATRLFHILPYIRFWPNLVKVTSTLTTTHAHKMVGSGVTMGSLGSKRSFSPKRHQVLQIT